MSGRYRNRKIVVNAFEQFRELFDSRGVRRIRHYGSPTLRHPTPEERSTLFMIPHFWSLGDRFYKLAFEHYGDEKLWWVIAWWNTAPTESHVKMGDVIYIPQPLNKLYDLIGY